MKRWPPRGGFTGEVGESAGAAAGLPGRGRLAPAVVCARSNLGRARNMGTTYVQGPGASGACGFGPVVAAVINDELREMRKKLRAVSRLNGVSLND